MHASRQTINYMYRTTPYQLYNWSGNRSDKFVDNDNDTSRPTKILKMDSRKKRWIWEHFDIANLLITYFSIFEKTFQINDKNLIDSVLFSLFFLLCQYFISLLLFFFWSLNKGVFMTSHRALTGCKSTKA